MMLILVKSKWEMWHDPLEPFLERASRDGFGATEIFLATEQAPAGEIADMHRQFGLDLVGQVLTSGASPDDHIRSLEEQFEFALECRPICINHHAGRDIFPFEENVRILQQVIELGRQHGMPVMVETHRGRATFSATDTRRYLEVLPDLRLTADFSHWMVVHESNLEDQAETLELAISRSDHIHARVGYEEGPQVPDPRAPEWAGHVKRHLDIWRRIAEHHRQRGSARLTVTPEFGPPQYMHTLPFSNEPVADAWEVNVHMRDVVQAALGPRQNPEAPEHAAAGV